MVFYVAFVISLLASTAAWAQATVSRQAAAFAGAFAGGPTAYTMARPEPLGWLNNRGFTACGGFTTVNSGAATVKIENAQQLPVRVQTVHGELPLGGGELTGTQCLTVNNDGTAFLLPGVAGGVLADPVLVSPHTVTRSEWVFGQQYVADNTDITLNLPDPATLSDQSGITIQTVDGTMTLVPSAGNGINGFGPGVSVVIPKNVTTIVTTSAQPGARAFRVAIGTGGGGGGGAGPGGGQCDADANFFARIPPALALDATYHEAYRNLICNLKTDGVLAQLDALYVLATRDEALAEMNLVSENYGLTKHEAGGRPVFTAKQGFMMGPDGNTDVYFDTHLNPTTGSGLKYTRDSAHVMAWSFGDYQSTGYSYVVVAGDGTNNTGMVPRNINGVANCAVNQSNADPTWTYGVPNTYGAFICNRTGSATIGLYLRGVSLTNIDTGGNAAAIPNAVFGLGGDGASGLGGPWILRAASIGAGLTGGLVANPPGVGSGTQGLIPRLCQFFIAIGGICE